MEREDRSCVLAMAFTLLAMASDLRAMASHLISNCCSCCFLGFQETFQAMDTELCLKGVFQRMGTTAVCTLCLGWVGKAVPG